MNKKLLFDIAKLRVSVAYLGEINHWWSSNFFKPDAVEFVKYILPRSKKANIISSFDVACAEMDKNVGANYYHLFRFGIKNEELLFRTIQELDYDIISEQEALETLEKLSNNLGIEGTPGPKNIGNIEQILSSDTISVFASEFLNAFINKYKVYPYLN